MPNTIPSGKMLRQDGAVPYTSQIQNNSVNNGNMLGDAMANMARLKGTVSDLELQTLNDEQTVALGGVAGDVWMPTLAIVHITSITGAANGDSQITIGTSAGGTQILTATVLTDTNALNERFAIDLTGTVRAEIAANATIYAKCTTIDTGAGSVLNADVHLYGEIL